MGRVEDFWGGGELFEGKQGATKESYGRRVCSCELGYFSYLNKEFIQEFTGDYDIPWN